jgi:ketosteroid isomerase-like protein
MTQAALVLTACVFWEACSVNSRARDRAEIEKLHRKDVEASLAGDQAALAEAMTDDVVILQQGREPEIGRHSTLEARRRNANPRFRVLSYIPEIKDVTIAGGWAFEWGYFTGSFVEAPGVE